MNTITFTGRLTADPELKQTPKGSVSEVRVANNDRQDTTFVPVTVWAKQAEAVAKYLAKGSQVAVTGRLAQDDWDTDDGQHRSRLYVVARSVDFLDPPSRGSSQPAGTAEE